MAKAIMFLGTGSDVGKSIAATAFCRIFKRKGYRVAPFKAQNMSNNSYVTVEGGEIGRAQVAQAEAADVLPSIHMNPVLLKPSAESGVQVILHGRPVGTMNAGAYYGMKAELKKAIRESYRELTKNYDVIVMEGAGSCCEMNLKENDLVNLPLAMEYKIPCILVSDIDRGGVFAQIIGTHQLMTSSERKLVLGSLINKFRGDPALFSSGMDYIAKKISRPVLGLIPYFQDINIDSEDSVVLQADKREQKPLDPQGVNIAVVRLPAISNFTDIEILEREKDVVLNYISDPADLSDGYDLLILPGTKNVMEDSIWMSRRGWKRKILGFVKKGKGVMGICGGYQLLGKRIKDPHGVESYRKYVTGLGLLPLETVLAREKIVRKVQGSCLLNNKRIKGYEIHMGMSRVLDETAGPFLNIRMPGKTVSWHDGLSIHRGKVTGTYVHGIFDSPGFRGDFLNGIRRDKGLREITPGKGRVAGFNEYDKLADHFEKYCDTDRIIEGTLKGI